jgi:hypothetical protein
MFVKKASILITGKVTACLSDIYFLNHISCKLLV